eukprot:gene5692-biopygen110
MTGQPVKVRDKHKRRSVYMATVLWASHHVHNLPVQQRCKTPLQLPTKTATPAMVNALTSDIADFHGNSGGAHNHALNDKGHENSTGDAQPHWRARANHVPDLAVPLEISLLSSRLCEVSWHEAEQGTDMDGANKLYYPLNTSPNIPTSLHHLTQDVKAAPYVDYKAVLYIPQGGTRASLCSG